MYAKSLGIKDLCVSTCAMSLAMSRSAYSISVAFWVNVFIRTLVAGFVFSSHVTEQQYGWPPGIGFGAVCTFSVFSVMAACAFATSQRLAPINALRLAVGMFLLFSAFALLPADKALYVISFGILGLAAATGSVLLWWARGQYDRQEVVLQRFSLISAFSNVPLAILGTLMHTRHSPFMLIAAAASMVVGFVTLLWLQQTVYTRCFRVPVPKAVWAPGYGGDNLLYNDETNTFNVFEPPKTTASTEEPQLELRAATLSLPELEKREMQQFTIGGDDDEDHVEVDTSSEAAQTEVSRSTMGPEARKFQAEAALAASAIAVERAPIQPPTVTFMVPSKALQMRMNLWLGWWTGVLHFTLEALIYYNVSGFSGIGAPWYITSTAVGAYTTVIVLCLSYCVQRRLSQKTGFMPYTLWYKYTVMVLIVATMFHAILEMSPWIYVYAPHVALSLLYMPPLILVSSLPLFRTLELCRLHRFSFYTQLPQWFIAVIVGQACAYVFEYGVLYFDMQMLAMIALCLVNMIMYNWLRRDGCAAGDDVVATDGV